MSDSDDRSRWTMAEREKHPLRPGLKRNTGEKQARSKGKSAEVALMNGQIAGKWSTDSTRWNFTGWWMDVDQYRIV